jgi:phosphate acyltransferase
LRIAIDAMGGDEAPGSIIDGALVAARHLQVGLLLVGYPPVTLLHVQQKESRLQIQECVHAVNLARHELTVLALFVTETTRG